MISESSKPYPLLLRYHKYLQEGILISIDPSIGSNSSMPGWALYRAGVLIASGTFRIKPDESVPERLQKLNYFTRKLFAEYNPDIVVYEDIPSMRFGGGNANAHASLLKAVGAILSISGPLEFIGISPVSWKKLARSTYVKSDQNDAIELGWIAISQSEEIFRREEVRIRRRRGSRKSSPSESEAD